MVEAVAVDAAEVVEDGATGSVAIVWDVAALMQAVNATATSGVQDTFSPLLPHYAIHVTCNNEATPMTSSAERTNGCDLKVWTQHVR